MGGRKGARLAVAVLAGGAGALLLLDLHLLRSPVDVSPVAPPMGKADARLAQAPQLATALDKKTAEQFRVTVNRPLFNPSRKPVQPQKAGGVAAKAAAGKLRLIGVMKLGEGPPRALIRFSNEGTGRWIAEGDEHKGWKLRKVNAHSVIVQVDGRSQELRLFSPPRRAQQQPRAKAPAVQ